MEINNISLLYLPTYYRKRSNKSYINKYNNNEINLIGMSSYNLKDNKNKLFKYKKDYKNDIDEEWIERAVKTTQKYIYKHEYHEMVNNSCQTDFSFIGEERDRYKKGINKLNKLFDDYDRLLTLKYYKLCFESWKDVWKPTQVFLFYL